MSIAHYIFYRFPQRFDLSYNVSSIETAVFQTLHILIASILLFSSLFFLRRQREIQSQLLSFSPPKSKLDNYHTNPIMCLNPVPVPQPREPPRFGAARPVHILPDGPAPDNRCIDGHYWWCPVPCGGIHPRHGPRAQMPRDLRSHRIREPRREVWTEVLPTYIREREPFRIPERRIVGSDGRLVRFDEGSSVGIRRENSYAYPRGQHSRGPPPPYDAYTNNSAYPGLTRHGSHHSNPPAYGSPPHGSHRSNPPTYSQSGTEHPYQYRDEGRQSRSRDFPGSELTYTGTVVRTHPRGRPVQESRRAHSRPRQAIEGPRGSRHLRLES